jgi:hypothetical protein
VPWKLPHWRLHHQLHRSCLLLLLAGLLLLPLLLVLPAGC